MRRVMRVPPPSLPSSGSIRSRGSSRTSVETPPLARPLPWREHRQLPWRERTRVRKVSPRRRGRAAGGPAMTKNDLSYSVAGAGGFSRRRLVRGAVGLGLAAARGNVGSRAAVTRAAAQEAGGPGPAADRLIFSAFNVDQAP